MAFLMNTIFKYRKKVILENIRLAKITEKTGISERKLLSGIYKNLMDISLESIKGFSLSEKQIAKRHIVNNPELLDKAYSNNQSVLLVVGHYGNWEWGAFSPNFYLNHKIVALYKPLMNPLVEKFVLKRRASFGSVMASIDHTGKFFEENVDKTAMFLMAADQSPTRPDRALWIPFLGIPTPCIHGIEKYQEKYKLPVVYAEIIRMKRGLYHINLSWVKKDADLQESGKLTYDYMKKLEKTILRDPSNWLWSHRRWKHKDKYPGKYDYTAIEND